MEKGSQRSDIRIYTQLYARSPPNDIPMVLRAEERLGIRYKDSIFEAGCSDGLCTIVGGHCQFASKLDGDETGTTLHLRQRQSKGQSVE